ncbi:Nucleotide-binding protein [Myxococcaceae bacterium]|nr:Nucleotide-binding protein [Myxococcaceae bacterium]
MNPSIAPRTVFVSGLSGGGKSTAMAALEDLGFYCVDNLPPQLVAQFVDLCSKATPPIRKVAVAVDTREEGFLVQVPGVVQQLRAEGHDVEVIFLDCADEVLVNRYRETRRVHPLSPAGSVQEGIDRERKLLLEVAQLADFRVDTTVLNVHQLKEAMARHVSGGVRATVLSLISFGFRFGPPTSAELLFDVRFLPNPHFEPALRAKTGEDPEVARYVLDDARTKELLRRLEDLLGFLLPLYDREGKAYLTIGIGCTGGQHRSVAIALALARLLRAAGREVNVSHRDLGKGE